MWSRLQSAALCDHLDSDDAQVGPLLCNVWREWKPTATFLCLSSLPASVLPFKYADKATCFQQNRYCCKLLITQQSFHRKGWIEKAKSCNDLPVMQIQDQISILWTHIHLFVGKA